MLTLHQFRIAQLANTGRCQNQNMPLEMSCNTLYSFYWRTTSFSIQKCISSNERPYLNVAPHPLNWSSAQMTLNVSAVFGTTVVKSNHDLKQMSSIDHYCKTMINHEVSVPQSNHAVQPWSVSWQSCNLGDIY